MLRPATILALGNFLSAAFYAVGQHQGWVLRDELSDFFYEREYPEIWRGFPYGCDKARDLVDFVTYRDRSVAAMAPGEEKDEARRRVDDELRRLAADLLGASLPFGHTHSRERKALLSRLELDGYAYEGGKLLPVESEALEVQEEKGEVAATYARLGLPNAKVIENHLALTDEHYGAGKFHDAIHNARQYLEQVLLDVAEGWSASPLATTQLTGRKPPVDVRKYLESEKVVTTHEIEVIRTTYGLLSETGGHPGMSERDQARIFRRLALAMAQYALLRYEAKTKPSP